MEVWIDAQLPPALASALRERHGADAKHVFEFGLTSARDEVIFSAARSANAIIVTKDADFVRIQEREGQPPRIL